MLLVAVLSLLALVGVALLGPSGFLAPRLTVGGTAEWTTASQLTSPSLTFSMDNRGWSTITLLRVDDEVVGLGSPSYEYIRGIAPNGSPISIQGERVTIPPRGSLQITLRYGSFNCAKLKTNTDLTVVFQARTVVGVAKSVSLRPLVSSPP